LCHSSIYKAVYYFLTKLFQQFSGSKWGIQRCTTSEYEKEWEWEQKGRELENLIINNLTHGLMSHLLNYSFSEILFKKLKHSL
jgi:hypothetical protein